MSTRMLIDARHTEETRVTVVKGNRVEEFDYESSSRRQLKGNIYLARVTRVEPSLQAAFVEYGGNRHGFLAFSEIHPDYYQIPVEDREALKAEETAEAETAKEADEPKAAPKPRTRRRRGGRNNNAAEAVTNDDAAVSEDHDDAGADSLADADNTDSEDAEGPTVVQTGDEEEKDDALEEIATRRRQLKTLKRKYNIQEVIKRRQVLLIQVVKEERGNKGAALTTYLSLAGRYCVLMPNSTHAGGISRKISSIADRKKLKQIITSLEVPDDMGMIVRTAGIERTKLEIKRDYDYLLRLWNDIRDLTLKSTAPALVYEEGNLIKRTIRDIYTRDVDEILVEGEEGYRLAKDFMKLLMPSHAKKVQHYKDRIPLFHRYQVESHLEAMYQPVVQLRSGGYIVINPTEALISIDVNSGRATKEHNIEETALKTNMEAAEEIARQLRLRDMAGLIVIDFIDMEDRNNNRSVERRIKEVLKPDRARIQVGRISSFGLMEMSRQRMRPNLLEVAMEPCKHCAGTGIVRSVESAALMALRQLEEEGVRNRSSVIRIAANPVVAIYLLNKKRAIITEMEQHYNMMVEVLAQPSLPQSDIELTRENAVVTAQEHTAPETTAITQESASPVASTAPVATASVPVKAMEKQTVAADDASDEQPRKRRRRRRRRRRGGEDSVEGQENQRSAEAANTSNVRTKEGDTTEADPEESADAGPKEGVANSAPREQQKRRRGTRGGRRRRGERTPQSPQDEEGSVSAEATEATPVPNAAPVAEAPVPAETAEEAAKPAPRRRRTRKAPPAAETVNQEVTVPADTPKTEIAPTEAKPADAEPSTAAKEPARRPRKKPVTASDSQKAAETAVPETEAKGTAKVDAVKKPTTRAPRKRATPSASKAESATPAPVKAAPAPKPAVAVPSKTTEAPTEGGSVGEGGPRRKGWWQRTFG